MKLDKDKIYSVLDTETTGIETKMGHRIIEIGALKIINGKVSQEKFHYYVNPNREVEAEAIKVHGITNEFLQDKPVFKEVAKEFIEFIKGTVLVIHNAPFDVGFLNAELKVLNDEENFPSLDKLCPVFDTLIFARNKHPGQRNSLDALCKRYSVNNSHRQYHGALMDAEILADVYLSMLSGQDSLDISIESAHAGHEYTGIIKTPIHVPRFDDAIHQKRLASIDKASGGQCLWLKAG